MTYAPILMKLDLGKEIAEELEIEEIFSFTLFGQKISVDETTVVSWIIIAVMTVLALILTRNLKVEGPISKRQAFLEMLYEKGEGFFKGLIGEKGHGYIPWLMSMALFIGCCNIIGIFSPTFFGSLKAPTKSMQVTAVMALTSIFVVELASFRAKGFKGRLKAFAEPIWIITPINILEVFTKPLSLAMRLFGNVLAAFTIMELIKIVTRNTVLPIFLSLYFDIFDGLLQAYIFVFLTALYIEEGIVETEKPPKEKKKKKKRKYKEVKA